MATENNAESPIGTKGKLVEAKETSSGCIDFLFVFTLVTCGAIGCAVIVIFTIGLSVATVVIGGVYLGHCRAEPYIPIWLMEWGVLSLARKFAFITSSELTMKEDQRDKHKYTTLDLLIGWWPIIGSILTFRIYKDVDHEYEESDNYCHPVLYKFTFFLLVFTLVGVALTAIGKIYTSCQNCTKKRRDEENVEVGIEVELS